MTPLIPWPPEPDLDAADPEVEPDGLMVFVPAIMSVGLVFSLVTLLRDAFRWTGSRARRRRTELEASAVVGTLLGEPMPDPEDLGILSRPTYLVVGLVSIAGAAYVAIGSTANFLREQGYVRDIGWLLAISLALSVLLGFIGGVAFAVFRSWPHPPGWTYWPLRTAPLTVTPTQRGAGPTWALSAWMIACAVALAIVTLIVGSGRSVALDIDRPIARWLVEVEWIERLSVIDPFGGTAISIGFVALIGLSGFRCKVMAVTFPLAFLAAWISGAAIRTLIERPRPGSFGNFESFPSGHIVQAVFIAGLVPLAVSVLFADRRLATAIRVVLAAAVVATALHRIHREHHWPLDVVGGALLGLTVVLATHWVLEHRAWHRGCESCPWSAHPSGTPWRVDVLAFGPTTQRRVGLAGAYGAVAAAVLLAVATVAIGLPTDPEGFGLGSTLSEPVQLGLAGLTGTAGLVALRNRAVGAVAMALAATGLGLFAAVEYHPAVAVTVSTVLLVPAVLTWLAWQPTESLGRITMLAAVTASLLTVTGTGAVEIHGYYFGPTHVDSLADDLDSEADWLWVGGVGTDAATVVAGGLDDRTATLRYWPAADPTMALTTRTAPDDDELARFVLTGLEPQTEYRYQVLDDHEPDEWTMVARGDSGFTTFAVGPQDLLVVVGSCARSGSNAAVFDAIVHERPDLFVALGDLHYGNLQSTDPTDHIRAYARSLSQPGQAALFAAAPTAYVWDDHDYGPNDADGSAPSRLAVSEAYRRAVPHYGVDIQTDSPINQAFTIGRVRFVLTDGRSQRSADSLLGHEQQQWLIDELTTSASTHALVIWANPTPWIGPATSTGDGWSAYPEDRREIADALAQAGVDNLVMISGDAHMVAIDDGTNSGYGGDGSPGFPVLHAGALDRPGSVKGGPYSHGAFPGAGQYGRLEIHDDGGDVVRVRLSGHDWRQSTLVELDLAFEVGREP